MQFNINSKIFRTPEFYYKKCNKLEPCNKCAIIPPTEIKYAKRIIAIGDIHGDFYSLLHALHKSKVINKNGL
jgi:hypothetical protein